MKYFVLFCYASHFLITVLSEQPVAKTIPKCCLDGAKLIKISERGFNEFMCLDTLDSLANSTNYDIIGDTEPLYGSKIQSALIFVSNSTSALPECRAHTLSAINHIESVEIPMPACLAKIQGSLLMVACHNNQFEANDRVTNYRPQRLSVVRKCCPFNFFYNEISHKCLQHTANMSTLYNEIFYYPTVFTDEPIPCSREKVLIEYTLSPYEMYFENGRLIITKHRRTYGFNEYCMEPIVQETTPDIGEPAKKFIVRICTDNNMCRYLPCIRRCCADGEIFKKVNRTSQCSRDDTDIAYHSFESLLISGNFSKPQVFGMLRGLDCQKFRLDPSAYNDEAHIISARDGSLYVMNSQRNYTNNQYCIEKVRNSLSDDQKLYTFLCFDTKVVGKDQIRFKLYPVGLLISCGFYGLTLLVYLTISKLRNLPGKILICLVSSLLCAYVSIALGQLMPTPNDRVCFISGFFIYFCLMAAFAWMNVMCFDIWQAFGSTRKKHSFKNNHTKRFLLYSLYGWGLPTTITSVTVSLTKSNLLPENIRPQFGHGRCWFTYDTLASANLLFFSGPVGVLFLINFVLFSLTLRYCNKVKREIFRMQSSNTEKPVLRKRFFLDKARFAMNTKLFIVMGITWILELLSIILYDHKKTFFWLISDSFNVLLGVSVFFIFVFKKRVWVLIKEVFGLQPPSNFNKMPGVTQTTYATSMSMARLKSHDGKMELLTPTPTPTSTRRAPSFSM